MDFLENFQVDEKCENEAFFARKLYQNASKIRYPRKLRFCYKFTLSPEFPKKNSQFLGDFSRIGQESVIFLLL